MEVKVTQSCPTLCDPMDYTGHGILQVRILEWIAFAFSRGSSQPRDQTRVSRVAGGNSMNCIVHGGHKESDMTEGLSLSRGCNVQSGDYS